MNRLRLITLTCLILSMTLHAEEQQDTAFKNLYKQYYELYEQDDEQKFQEISDKMKDYYLKHGQILPYYKMRVNEILYDAENGKSYRAIKKANLMLEDMKKEDEKHYELVYSALGAIYEARGNYRLADRYYQDALKNCSPKDTGSLISIYSRIASLKSSREPEKAWFWNERFGAIAQGHPGYYKLYLALKGEISFYMNDRSRFNKAYKEFTDYLETADILDNYGIITMKTLYAAINGDYQEALRLTESKVNELSELDRCDLRIKIFELMGDSKRALEEVAKRRDLRDSLNSDLMFNNINEINAEIGAVKERENAAKEREILFGTIIALLLLALGLTISRYFMRQRYQKKLLHQNEELEIALSEAKESDRMKSLFIEHVSHEIRTPLNIITGFVQVINNPNYEVEEKERNKMLEDIAENTNAITDILNDLLEMAQDESKERYRRNDTIHINALCRKLTDAVRAKNSERLSIAFKTELPDEETMLSNEKAIEKVLRQLLGNATKFTEKGSIELYVHESPDHGCIRFVVTDTGIGIAEELHEKVFERFYKVDSFKQGFGLGLTASRKIAILLDGSLEIDTTYTNGARFILTLPVGIITEN